MKDSKKGPLVVITGASSGIGKEAAIKFAIRGWRVIGIGRSPDRCEAARTEILNQAPPGSHVEMICSDIGILGEVEVVVEKVNATTDSVNALINNAGGLTKDFKTTPEGVEYTFASNHLGHFYLTNRLLPLVREAARQFTDRPARVINMSSSAHEACDGLDWEDLQMKREYSSTPAYCRAKLANILFTRELAGRLLDENIAVHAMHPGMVDSNFVNYGDDAMQSYFKANLGDAKRPQEAAEDLVWLTLSQQAGEGTGEYFFERERISPNRAAQNEAAGRMLWEQSAKLVSEITGNKISA